MTTLRFFPQTGLTSTEEKDTNLQENSLFLNENSTYWITQKWLLAVETRINIIQAWLEKIQTERTTARRLLLERL